MGAEIEPNREIGTHVQISEGAVKPSLSLLFEKLNVKTRTQLVKVALKQYPDQLQALLCGGARTARARLRRLPPREPRTWPT